MENKSLIEKISYNNGRFPKNELIEIIERKEEFIPELLDIAKDITVHYEDYLDRNTYFGHLYSFYLLAQCRVRELFPILIDFLKLPSDVVDTLLGDFLTEDAGRVLATLYEKEEDVNLLKGLFENKDVNVYARGQGLRALVVLVLHNKLNREEVLQYFEQQLKLEINAVNRDIEIITDIISCSNDLYPDLMIDTIEKAFDSDLVDTWVIVQDFIHRTLEKNKDEVLYEERSYPSHTFIEDTIKEMQYWASFDKDYKDRMNKKNSNTSRSSKKIKFPSNNKPIVNELKVGRNDPCPCGSGKKYKKCCAQ